MFANGRRKFQRAVDGMPPRHALATYVDFYVSRATATIARAVVRSPRSTPDLPRQSKAVRKAFDGGLRSLVAGIERLIKEAGIEGDAEALAASVTSAMAGASRSRAPFPTGISPTRCWRRRARASRRGSASPTSISQARGCNDDDLCRRHAASLSRPQTSCRAAQARADRGRRGAGRDPGRRGVDRDAGVGGLHRRLPMSKPIPPSSRRRCRA